MIVIGERRHEAGVDDIDLKGGGLFAHGLIRALVDEKEVGGVVVTDIDIQVPILIDIDHGRTCRPLVGVGGEARGGCVGEIEGIHLLEKRIGYRRPSKK